MLMRFMAFVVTMMLPLIAFSPVRADEVSGKVGILVMAHGSHTNPLLNKPIEDAVAPLRSVVPTVISFGMAERDSLQEAVHQLEAEGVTHIAMVRLLVSPLSFLHQAEYLLGLRPDPPEKFFEHDGYTDHVPPLVHRHADISLSREGLYDSPLMGEVLADRVRAVSSSPESESVVVIAHGTGDDAENDLWDSRIDHLAEKVRELAPFRAVRVFTTREDWAEKQTVALERVRDFVYEEVYDNDATVIVVPFKVSGYGAMGLMWGEDGRPYYGDQLSGLPHVPTRGLLPHPKVTEWIESQAVDIFSREGWSNPFVPGLDLVVDVAGTVESDARAAVTIGLANGVADRDLVVELGATAGAFYADAQSGDPITSVTIPAATGNVRVYFETDEPEGTEITLTARVVNVTDVVTEVVSETIVVGLTPAQETTIRRGWNVISTPWYLDPARQSIDQVLDRSDLVEQAYGFANGRWFQVTADDPDSMKLRPLEALYIKLRGASQARLFARRAPAEPPTRRLTDGWNLIGSPAAEAKAADQALVSVGDAWRISVSPAVNQNGWSVVPDTAATVETEPFRGYWVYLEQPGTLAGFETTPVRP